jgi:ubiquinone/menaquinone biosynthesis C-methylase UbiE
MKSLADRYADLYERTKTSRKLWPTEFLVRALLSESHYVKKGENDDSALDLGFGDGRNIELLKSKFARVYGVEIAESICELARKRYPDCEFRNGFTDCIPFLSDYFDLVVAVHSLYYCQQAFFDEILNECRRVLKPCSRLIFSVPKPTSYLLKDAILLPDEYAYIQADPLGIRTGVRIKYFADSSSVERSLKSAGFRDVIVGSVIANWWGISEDYWIVSCERLG